MKLRRVNLRKVIIDNFDLDIKTFTFTKDFNSYTAQSKVEGVDVTVRIDDKDWMNSLIHHIKWQLRSWRMRICPKCQTKMECAVDIDKLFYSDNAGSDVDWFCTLVSYFCPECECMSVEIEGGRGKSVID